MVPSGTRRRWGAPRCALASVPAQPWLWPSKKNTSPSSSCGSPRRHSPGSPWDRVPFHQLQLAPPHSTGQLARRSRASLADSARRSLTSASCSMRRTRLSASWSSSSTSTLGPWFTPVNAAAHRQHPAVRHRGDRYPAASRDELDAPHKINDEHDDQNEDEGADSDIHVS